MISTVLVRTLLALAGAAQGPPAQQGVPQVEERVVQGIVEKIDVAAGSITVSTSGGLVVLRGRGVDFLPYAPGQTVALRYEVFHGQPWLEMQPHAPPAFAPAGRVGQAVGVVTDVNRQEGLVEVQGITGRAHPRQLRRVIPGQFVSVTFVYLAGLPTVQRIQPAP